MDTRNRKFHCMMTSEDFDKLTWLAEHCGLSRSTIVRQSIWLRHQVTNGRVNVCADGHQCLCRERRQFPTSFETKEEEEGEESGQQEEIQDMGGGCEGTPET